MVFKDSIGNTEIVFELGDITTQDTKAIVNAANSSLMGGGGVDGAIHRAGGPEILNECKIIREKSGKCPAGDAVITGGGNLKADYVIHTVGPIWNGGRKNEDKTLASAYLRSLEIAKENGINSLSFPSISTGAYRFPIERAARIALLTIKEFAENNECFDEIRVILHAQKDYNIYYNTWKEIKNEH